MCLQGIGAKVPSGSSPQLVTGEANGSRIDLHVRDKENQNTTSLWNRYTEPVNDYSNIANASPEYIYIDMAGYDRVAVQIEQTGGLDTFTIKYEASLEGTDGTVTWHDFSTVFTFLTGSVTTDHIANSPVNFSPKAFRITITTAGGNNDSDYKVSYKRWKQ